MTEPLDVAVICHTHWDREWYQPAGVFRQRLVALVDELLDENPAADPSHTFLLDGQAVVLDDYLAVRGERRAELAAHLATGAIEAGPWYVLADELIASGESLVRNLLAGRRALASLGAEAPPVLYSPDAFGHTGAMPVLAEGFGLPLAIVWRGYGGARWPSGDTMWWRAPNGSRVLTVHLPPDGYEFGSSLPITSDPARERWARLRAVLAPRARLGMVLVQNGADHHARQRGWQRALGALADVAQPDRVTHVSLREYASAVVTRAASADLPSVDGELRDSYGYTWTLQGTFASRAAQKRRNALIDRTLTRDVEPWLALLALGDRLGGAMRANVHAAWRTLLLNHPHDTLCGCSTDEVARAADARWDDAASQASALREDAVASLLGHDGNVARERGEARRSTLVVRNPSARRRGGVAEIELLAFERDVAVGPGSAQITRCPPTPHGAPVFEVDGVAMQVLARAHRYDRIEAPRHYPDNDLVESVRGVVWIDTMDGFTLRALPLGRLSEGTATGPSAPVSVRDVMMENAHVTVGLSGTIAVTARWQGIGASIDDLIGIEDVGDGGDLYTHSPIAPVIRDARITTASPVHVGPLRGELAFGVCWSAPAFAESPHPLARPDRRSDQRVDQQMDVRLILDADAEFVRVHLRGNDFANDHRLRIVFRTGVRNGVVHADAAFGPVKRARLDVPPVDTRAEHVVQSAPLHRWVSIANADVAATVISDGLAEYETTADGDIAITLVRGVGELSRADLPERPGHAGWPVATPQAQSRGMIEARFALALHAPHDAFDFIERMADDVLSPLVGETVRSALDVAPLAGGVTLEGEGLVCSAVKASEDGARVVLRCVNVSDRATSGAWHVRASLREASHSRLDETVGAPMSFESHAESSIVRIDVGPRGVHTIVVR